MPMTRNCESCTRCCEGWLSGIVNGKAFSSGRPCHYKSIKGCSIYNTRPVDPCRSYQCEWLMNSDLPEWLKPNLANIIITRRIVDDIEYLEIIETGHTISGPVLNWLILWALGNSINLHYQVGGGWNFVGTDEFKQIISSILSSDTSGGLTIIA